MTTEEQYRRYLHGRKLCKVAIELRDFLRTWLLDMRPDLDNAEDIAREEKYFVCWTLSNLQMLPDFFGGHLEEPKRKKIEAGLSATKEESRGPAADEVVSSTPKRRSANSLLPKRISQSVKPERSSHSVPNRKKSPNHISTVALPTISSAAKTRTKFVPLTTSKPRSYGAKLDVSSNQKAHAQNERSLIPRRIVPNRKEENGEEDDDETDRISVDDSVGDEAEGKAKTTHVEEKPEGASGNRVTHVTVPFSRKVDDMDIKLQFPDGLEKNASVVLHIESF